MWILLNPGPANTTATVRQALVMDDLCHREPECFEMMRRCRDGLVALSGAGPDFTAVLFAGSGTAAVEAAIASVVPPGRALCVVDNGVYGDRMGRIARSHGIPFHLVKSDIFTPADPAAVDRTLAEHDEISHVAIVSTRWRTSPASPTAGGGASSSTRPARSSASASTSRRTGSTS
jgi:2-aminoethylphosphonate-pyruvate transaminase